MNRTFDSSLRRVTVLWVFSLAVVALLALSSDVLLNNQVTRSETFAEFVNLTGRQRMWTSQVALHATQYVHAATAEERATHSRRLRQAIDTMMVEYDLVIEETAEVPAIVGLFRDGDMAIGMLVPVYWQAADDLLALPQESLAADAAPYRYIRNNSDFLVTQFDAVTRSLIDYNGEVKQSIQSLNDLRVAVVLVVLALQFVFVFRPALSGLRQRAGALEKEIAERKRAEARFRQLAETAPVGIYQSDLKGEMIWVNHRWQEITGLGEGDAAKWTGLVHPEDAGVLEQARRQLDDGQMMMADYRIRRQDGVTLSLHSTATLTRDDGGTVTGILGTIMDITERKLAEERAIKLEGERQRIKVLGEFIRDTSHDLRTPLTVIKSGLSLVRRLNDVERIHEKTVTLEEYVNYLNVVIDQLQEMAVLDTLTDLTLMPTDMTALLRDTCRDLLQHPDAARKRVHVEIDPHLPQANVAADKFASAVRAVVDNARRYTNTGDQITIAAAENNGRVVVTVSDTGIGIAPEHLPRVVERFYKVDKARGVGGGAGLGLPIARRIVELHGGTIDIKSEPGAGTTVTITVPIARA